MYSIIYVTNSNKKEAKKLGKLLVKEKLVACVNIFPIESIYEWKGKLVEDKEYVLIGKTKTKLIKKIRNFVEKNHKYECPCVVDFPIKGNRKYLDWIKSIVK